MKATDQLVCNSGNATLTASLGYLNATRGGFLNRHAEAAPGGSATSARQYPMNFDVEQFQLALEQTGVGELGSYFGAGKFENHDFNGIVYITNTWQNSLRGMDGTATAATYPAQGNQIDNDTVEPSATIYNPRRVQNALPFELCSSDLNGQDFDGDPVGPGAAGLTGFSIPKCASYQVGAPSMIQARPYVIRIHNGQNLRPVVLPKGLTIATNLPAYILGDYNTSSDVSSAGAANWVPALVAADFVSELSNNWDDTRSFWQHTNANAYVARPATNTTFNTSILAGYVVRATNGGGSDSADGINTFTRYNEAWDGITHYVNGSLVVGFSSVYFKWSNDTGSYGAPNRNWKYDPHLLSVNRQPPGTPYFFVYAVEDWHSGK
jgi:hypothetical protein